MCALGGAIAGGVIYLLTSDKPSGAGLDGSAAVGGLAGLTLGASLVVGGAAAEAATIGMAGTFAQLGSTAVAITLAGGAAAGATGKNIENTIDGKPAMKGVADAAVNSMAAQTVAPITAGFGTGVAATIANAALRSGAEKGAAVAVTKVTEHLITNIADATVGQVISPPPPPPPRRQEQCAKAPDGEYHC